MGVNKKQSNDNKWQQIGKIWTGLNVTKKMSNRMMVQENDLPSHTSQ